MAYLTLVALMRLPAVRNAELNAQKEELTTETQRQGGQLDSERLVQTEAVLPRF